MKNLLAKELKLSALPLSYFFILFGVMAMIPGYPILVGAFFVCLGIYQSFQNGRENNDILYTVLLPVKKSDAVKAKFAFTCFIELCSLALMFVLTMVRMIWFANSPVYTQNVLMNANPVFLAWALVIFSLFNLIFVNGFFATAYKIGKPFIIFIIAAFAVVGIAEALHFIPGNEYLNATDCIADIRLWFILAAGVIVYIVVTLISVKGATRKFEIIDL